PEREATEATEAEATETETPEETATKKAVAKVAEAAKEAKATRKANRAEKRQKRAQAKGRSEPETPKTPNRRRLVFSDEESNEESPHIIVDFTNETTPAAPPSEERCQNSPPRAQGEKWNHFWKTGGVNSPSTPSKGDSYVVRAYTNTRIKDGEAWVEVLWGAPYEDEPAQWCRVKGLGIPLNETFLRRIKRNAQKGEETSALPEESDGTSDKSD
ncbi:MAG: hypothetical protein ACK8QZ_09290, partial [Anaerolineales bacterium]